MAHRLEMKRVGPIRSADVTFGDLTVVVGPQATGKSIFLQTLKLLLDRPVIQRRFGDFGVEFNGDSAAFLGGYFGKGMAAAWKRDSALNWRDKPFTFPGLAKRSLAHDPQERLFFIPAQRVMSLDKGQTQNFGQFEYGDPYTLRDFSNTLHALVQNEFGAKGELFPQRNRLNAVLRKPIVEHLYGGSSLIVDAKEFTKRLVLKVPGHKEGLPYTAWSAGQREFTPLLLGLYWLCPGGPGKRRDAIEWVVIEEPEMGLHPQGVEAVLLLVLELLQRGYRVVVSTHSPVVLDLVWALQEFKRHGGTGADVRRLFGLGASAFARKLGESVLDKDLRVYFFERGAQVRDISGLDPQADAEQEALWGGLVGFASRTGQLIADVVNRESLLQPDKTSRRRAKRPEPSQ
jgi:hypothetical protein